MSSRSRNWGARIFEGTLTDDQNATIGSVTDEIELGDLEATIPGGELAFEGHSA
ncbi:MAG: hypothetical protein JSV78_01520 [Phycisphaerales bacterium]|nr:MAG: hypothetical protein JSV78_01520 [Phycisphaerales bacterium]